MTISTGASRVFSQWKYIVPVLLIAGFLAFSTNIFGLKASILYIQPTVKLSVSNMVHSNFSYHSLGGAVNGTTIPATVMLENEGSTPLVVNSVAMTSAPGQYSITGLPATPFTVTTTPITFQVTSIATLPVNSTSYLNVGALDILSNDPLSPLFEVKFITNITSVPEPEIDVTVNGVSNMFSQTFDFGNINLNAVVSADINIANATPISYPDLKILATPTLSTADFSLGGTIPTPGMQIASSSSTSAMKVFVDTSSIGQKTGTLEITSDDTDEAIYRIPFTARVVGTPLINFLPNQYTIHENGMNITGQVILSGPVTSNTIVNFTSSNTGALDTPANITITAGNSSGYFILSAPVDTNATNETVSITASATGFISGAATVYVIDNMQPSLTFTPNTYSVTEQATNPTDVTISIPSPASSNININLINSNTTSLTVPTTAIITAGNTSTTFPITAPDEPNTINETVTITASTTGYNSATATIDVTDNDSVITPTLTFNPNTYAVTEEASTATTITLNVSPAPTTPLTVTLTNSNASSLNVPSTATIATGASATVFTISAPHDTNITNETVTITASTPGYTSGTSTINISDNDVPVISTLSFNPNTYSIVEQASTATNVTLNITPTPTAPVTVTLTNPNPTSLNIPATASFAIGNTSTTFPVSALNEGNTINETVIITASATGYTSGTATITTIDNDSGASIIFNPNTYSITELGANVTVTLLANIAPTVNTTIALTSSNTPSLTVPTSVILNAGSNSTTFQISAPDDGNTVNETITLTATTPGYTSGTATVTVTDSGNSIPSIIYALPSNNAPNIGLNTNVVVAFSEPVVLNFPTDYSLSGKVRFFKTSAPTVLIPSAVTYSPSNNTFVINPTNNLDPSANYTFFVSNTIQDVANNNLSSSLQSTFTTGTVADTIAPTILSITPANNSTNVPVASNTTEVFITFSEPVVLFNNSYSANGPISVTKNALLVPASGVYQAGNATYKITFASNLISNTQYSINIANSVTDIVGNALVNNTTSTFTTEIIRPTVVGVYPFSGQTNVPLTTPITINFNEDVVTNSIQVTLTNTILNTPITLSTGTYTNLQGVFTYSIPTVTLSANTTYRIDVAPGLQSVASGSTLGNTYSTTFSTSSSSSTSPNVYVIPENGNEICTNASAMVAFDMPMNPNTLNTITIEQLTQPHGTVVAAVPHQATYTGMIGNRSFYIITPTNTWGSNQTYKITVPQTVQSISGTNPSQAKTTEFRAFSNGACHNNTPTLNLNPLSGTTNFPITGTLSAQTDVPFNPLSIHSQNVNIYTRINYTPVFYSIQWSNDMKTVILTPNQSFSLNTEYLFDIDSTVRNVQQENMPHTLSYFSTGDFLDIPGAPYVTQIVKNGNGEVRYNAPIEFWFNESVNPTTVNIQNVTLVTGNNDVVAGTIQQITSNKYRFNPTNPLRASTSYTFRVNTNVLDRGNNQLDQISSTVTLDPFSETFFTSQNGGSANNNGGHHGGGGGSNGNNGGGQVLGANDVINPIAGLSSSINVDCAVLDASLAVSTFPDVVSENQWPAKYIGALYKCGAFKGNEEGKAEMWRLISRAELTKIALIINNIEIETGLSIPFPDVSRSSWQYDVIATAYKYNIIKGYTNGTFGPNKTINRNEALKITLEAAGFDASKYTPNSYFTDTDRSHWSVPYQSFAKENDISKGYDDGSFKPNNPINRSESAKMFVETAQLIKDWFPPK